MNHSGFLLSLVFALGLIAASATAADFGVLHAFAAGHSAKANQANANFTALAAESNELKARLQELEESPLQEMAAFIEVDSNPSLVPTNAVTNVQSRYSLSISP